MNRPMMVAPESRKHPVPAGSARENAAGDLAVMFGALSVVAFWAFGVGVLLGLGALVVAAVARDRARATQEPIPVEAVLGVLAGLAGITAGVLFLAAVLPNL
ncbi:hypothetical protein ACVH9Z_10050 [Rhodococcus opacus]|uniref:hypothetical protein n=3 Tax=Nocardiaceae TaxID=85025 RepID=UPI0012DA128B|nr:hypothetical protein [Rhodococcus opacus]MDI9935196.1 hypothetical protein [Rhodococcus sp. IEGM 1351]MDX5969801.1 hypothetical protein [Rhodococcus opacus]NKY69940.1 hypothetical protein [Rhodococcus opacus]